MTQTTQKKEIASARPDQFPWLESGRPLPDGSFLWRKVFMKPLLSPTPHALEVWYEAGWNSLRHSHPMDEIFYVYGGKLVVNGYDLPAGSVVFVPKNTMYGPEYTGSEGCHFLRMELWDTVEGYIGGPPAERMGPDAARHLRVWKGALTKEGVPEGKNASVPTTLAEMSKDDAKGALAANGKEMPWIETILAAGKGTTAGMLFTKRLLHPAPDIEEVYLAPGAELPPVSWEVDKLYACVNGELTIGGHSVRRGGVIFVPKGTRYEIRAHASEGARYLRIILLDSQRPMPKGRAAESSVTHRTYTGPLTKDGTPVLSR